MGCNGWNHPDDCGCGWGGDTGAQVSGHGLASEAPLRTVTSDGFVNPNARCPVCGAAVFYYESESGGKVWFDELGPPWPKHPCMASRSAPVSSYEELLEFMGASMRPATAIRMAAELVRYAMADYRAPNRVWPDDELLEARSELLDWMFSRHKTNADHVVPLSELLKIIGFIEARAKLSVDSLQTWQTLLAGKQDDKSKKQLATFTEAAARGRKTLAIMGQVRAHYEQIDEHGDEGLRVVKDNKE